MNCYSTIQPGIDSQWPPLNSRPDGLPKRVRISFKYLRDNGNSCSVFYPSVQKGTSLKRVVFTGNYSVGLLSVLYNMLCHLCTYGFSHAVEKCLLVLRLSFHHRLFHNNGIT